MNQEPESSHEQKTKRLNGTIWSIVVLAVMVLALVAFVMAQDRTKTTTAIALTHTATYLRAQGTTPAPMETDISADVPVALANVNGILVAGGLLVLVVLFAIVREAVLHRKT